MHWLNHFDEEVVRINGDENRFTLEYIDSSGIFVRDTFQNRLINLCQAKSCWYRRQGLGKNLLQYQFSNFRNRQLFHEHNGDEQLKSYLDNESDTLLEYIYSRVEKSCQRRLGSYFKRNLNRLEVLELAAQYGFAIPTFWVATQEKQINELLAEKELVTKAAADGLYEVIGNRRYYTYTEKLFPHDIAEENAQNIFPTLVMEQVHKKFEVRCFYLYGTFYSMAIFSQGSSQTTVDFRKYNNTVPNRTEPFRLPSVEEGKLRKIFQQLGLSTGSADLIVNTNGEFVFLEINPGGQFGMVSGPCNYHLEQKVAKYLAYGLG